MTILPTAVPGVFKNGVIIPDTPTSLNDGERVLIVFGQPSEDELLAAEMAQWERVGDEAWSLIDQFEKESVDETG